jgi:hypothetical protein
VREPLRLIIFPAASLIFRVKNLRMVELLGLNLGEVGVDLEVPVGEDTRLAEGLDEVADALKPLGRVRDHIVTQLAHLVAIRGEVSGKACLVAAGGNQVDLLAALGKHQQRLIKLFSVKFDLPSLL